MADQPGDLNRCDHTAQTPFGQGCEHPWCPAGRDDPGRQAQAEEIAARVAELEQRVALATDPSPVAVPVREEEQQAERVCDDCGLPFTGYQHFHASEPYEGCDGDGMGWQVRGSEDDLVAEVRDVHWAEQIVQALNRPTPPVDVVAPEAAVETGAWSVDEDGPDRRPALRYDWTDDSPRVDPAWITRDLIPPDAWDALIRLVMRSSGPADVVAVPRAEWDALVGFMSGPIDAEMTPTAWTAGIANLACRLVAAVIPEGAAVLAADGPVSETGATEAGEPT